MAQTHNSQPFHPLISQLLSSHILINSLEQLYPKELSNSQERTSNLRNCPVLRCSTPSDLSTKEASGGKLCLLEDVVCGVQGRGGKRWWRVLSWDGGGLWSRPLLLVMTPEHRKD